MSDHVKWRVFRDQYGTWIAQRNPYWYRRFYSFSEAIKHAHRESCKDYLR